MSLRAVLATGLGSLLLCLGACGEDAVVVDSPVAHPYDGPLEVERDVSDDATVLGRSGAAGLALECTGAPFEGGGGDYADGGLESVQSSPHRALENFREESWVRLPDGFVVERVEDDRVLFSFDVDEHTLVAVTVADGVTDWDDDTGWGVEAWAMCDPAELPPEVAEALGHTVWQDADGDPVPVTTITSSPGPEHCDWEDIVFLRLGRAGSDSWQQYLRDTDGELTALLRTTYADDVALPAGAEATGYRHDGRELWLVPDGSAAYLVDVADPDDVERWPAPQEPIACA
jgi:hypothetical protein